LIYKLHPYDTVNQHLYWGWHLETGKVAGQLLRAFCCRHGAVWVMPWDRWLLCCHLWTMWGLHQTSGPGESHGWVLIV